MEIISYGGKATERFWNNVNRRTLDECWTWRLRLNKKGYGRFGVDMHVVMAHRAAWEIANGPIPDGMCVCHACDNPACVNPAHLFLGTIADNNRDMWGKGRGKITHQISSTTFTKEYFAAHRHPRAKLTPDDVRTIRAERERGVKLRILAKRFGVSATVVSKAARGDSWAHIR